MRSLLDGFKSFCACVVVGSALLALITIYSHAGAPGIVSYQGHVQANGVDFTGTGMFKFALVSGNGATTYWSNDGTSTTGNEPKAAVALPVANGLYSVILGDATLANMTPIPSTVFSTQDVRLRIWFNDGAAGSRQLSPDQRIAAVGYALVATIADTVVDGGITTAKIADATVTAPKLAQLPKCRVTQAVGELNFNPTLKVPFSRANYNYGSIWANATPTRLTAPIAGVYHFSAVYECPTTSDRDILAIIVNGAPGATVSFARPYAADHGNLVGDYYMNAGDYVELYARGDGSLARCVFTMNYVP